MDLVNQEFVQRLDIHQSHSTGRTL
jgi:hypothetical protein